MSLKILHSVVVRDVSGKQKQFSSCKYSYEPVNQLRIHLSKIFSEWTKLCYSGQFSFSTPSRHAAAKAQGDSEKRILHVRNVHVGKRILRNSRKFGPHKPTETETKLTQHSALELNQCGYLHLLCSVMKSRHDFNSKTRHTVDLPVTPAKSWTIFHRESHLHSSENKE